MSIVELYTQSERHPVGKKWLRTSQIQHTAQNSTENDISIRCSSTEIFSVANGGHVA